MLFVIVTFPLPSPEHVSALAYCATFIPAMPDRLIAASFDIVNSLYNIALRSVLVANGGFAPLARTVHHIVVCMSVPDRHSPPHRASCPLQFRRPSLSHPAGRWYLPVFPSLPLLVVEAKLR